MQRLLLAVLAAVSAAPLAACAQVCSPPSFQTIEPAPMQEDSVQVMPANLMRMHVPAGISRLALQPGGMGIAYDDGRRLSIDLDDGSLVKRNNDIDTPPGPLFTSMYQGSTREGCELLATWGLDKADYRITFSKGTVTVYAYGTGAEHQFEAIIRGRPEFVVRGMARHMDRAAFERILATIAPLKEE